MAPGGRENLCVTHSYLLTHKQFFIHGEEMKHRKYQVAGDPPCSFDYKCFIEFVLWLIHFFNYACPRAILNEFIFPIIEGGRSQSTWDIRMRSSRIFKFSREKLVEVNTETSLLEGNPILCIQSFTLLFGVWPRNSTFWK